VTLRRPENVPAGGLLIADRRVTDTTAGAYAHRYPGTGTVTAHVPLAGAAEMDTAVAAARAALSVWRRTPPNTRRDLMGRLADLIRADAATLTHLATAENGTPTAFAAACPAGAAEFWDYNAGWADKISGEVIATWPGAGFDYATSEPYGVVALRKIETSVDVTAAVDAGERLQMAATIWLPHEWKSPAVICFAWPGGGYSREYFSFDMPGSIGGGQAGWHARRGWIFVSFDTLNSGASTRLSRLELLTYENLAVSMRIAVDTLCDAFAASPVAEDLAPVLEPVRIGLGQSLGGRPRRAFLPSSAHKYWRLGPRDLHSGGTRGCIQWAGLALLRLVLPLRRRTARNHRSGHVGLPGPSTYASVGQ
jgi:hypothetical protein